ncbi:MAG: isoprenylcysteine carboxylmethyltransferase family protein [Pseudomonadota bacterium]
MKIPPPIQAFIAAGVMSMLAIVDRQPDRNLQLLALIFLMLGVSVAIIGVRQFRKFKTTISPIRLNSTSHLVTEGIYAYTRNPMYVGIVIVLIAWGLWLGSLLSLVVIPVFMFSIQHFQIIKEEQALTDLFGQEYKEYQKSVRRWL